MVVTIKPTIHTSLLTPCPNTRCNEDTEYPQILYHSSCKAVSPTTINDPINSSHIKNDPQA
eukprot:10577809-Ditylum_brightwellii.AAC.1